MGMFVVQHPDFYFNTAKKNGIFVESYILVAKAIEI